MLSPDRAKALLAKHGQTRPQPAQLWKGPFPLPSPLETFYREVGPLDVEIPGPANDIFLPGLGELWTFQAGYRWNGRTGELLPGWHDDWLVVGNEAGDPFIFSRASGRILMAQHGQGSWEPHPLFPDVTAMVACLAALGSIVKSAGESFTDEDGNITPIQRERGLREIGALLGASGDAEAVLGLLGWG